VSLNVQGSQFKNGYVLNGLFSFKSIGTVPQRTEIAFSFQCTELCWFTPSCI